MPEKTYPIFDVGAQVNSQQYGGGFWSGNDLDITSQVGIVQPSNGHQDLYSNDENLHLQVDTFTADGTWTCPAGVTSATVEAWGAGGGSTTNVGGGGGGAYAKSVITVVPTTGYAVVVGTSAADTDGENSTFDSTTVVAAGGKSGTNGGAGGTVADSTGDTEFAGGNAVTGTGTKPGGGGAGDTGAGGNGSGSVGGLGGTTNGGLAGGTDPAEHVGWTPGSGSPSTGTTQNAGQRGEVRVTYLVDQGVGYPVIRGRSWGRTTTDTTSHAIAMPAGILPGELLLVVFSVDSNPTCSIASGGWTKLGQDSNSTAVTQAIFYKVATGSDTATVTTSTSQGSSHIVLRVSGAAIPTATFANGNSTNANPPSHTSGSGTANRLWIASGSWDTNLSTTHQNISAPPSGYSGFVTENHNLVATGNTGGANTALATIFGTAATENPGTFTSTSENWVASTVAIEFDPSTSVGTSTIIDLAGYDGNNDYDVYALLNSGSTGKIIARNVDTETFDTLNEISENPVGALDGFNGSLYWATTVGIGKYDGTTFTDAHQVWQTTQDSGLFAPTVVFAGKMFWGNMRYIASLDASGTWDPDALILPADVRVLDMRIWNDQIAILAQKTGSNIGTNVYFWDGVNATYNEVIGVNEAQPMAIYSYLGSLLMWGLNGRIYEYRGISADGISDFKIIADVPGEPVLFNPSAVLMSDGVILFGIIGRSSNSLGIWAYGRLPGTNTVALYQKYTPKGDYKYDPGVTDYYSVTSLLNIRVNDSTLNPTESGTPDTWSADSAAGDSTWVGIEEKTQPDYSMKCVACDTDGSVVVMANDSIYYSTDGGDTFNESVQTGDAVGACADSDGSVMAVCYNEGGNILVSVNSGATWTSRASAQDWREVRCDDDGSVMAATYGVTPANDVYISTDSGTTWTSRTVATTTRCICMSSTGATMYAGTQGTGNDAVYKSTNTGTSWAASGETGMDNITQISCSSDGSVVVAASAEDNALWLSTDSGANWSQVSGLPAVDVECASISADGNKIIVGTQADDNGLSAVYYSDDQGTNWSWLGTITFPGTANLAQNGLCISRDGSHAYVVRANQTGGQSLTFWDITPIGTSVELDDNIYAYTGSKETALSSFYLKGLDPGLTIANGETITGIKVEVAMKKATGTTSKDVTVKLVKAGTIVGDNKGANTDRSLTETTYTYGGSNDLWGTTWTPAEVNASDFGVVIQASNTAAVMAIDYVNITVYTPPPTNVATQREFLYAAVQRGNATEVSESMVTGIVDVMAEGFTTANMITVGEDFELPGNLKRIQRIAVQMAKPLVGGEEIICYATEDDTTAQNLGSIAWTEIASWSVGEEGLWKYPPDPLTVRRLRLKFEIVPQSGNPATPPGLISYTLSYEPLKLFSNL